jgi:uncharacterized protein (DUF1786 family)
MKELIRRRLDVPAAGWVEQSMYLPRQIWMYFNRLRLQQRRPLIY